MARIVMARIVMDKPDQSQLTPEVKDPAPRMIVHEPPSNRVYTLSPNTWTLPPEGPAPLQVEKPIIPAPEISVLQNYIHKLEARVDEIRRQLDAALEAKALEITHRTQLQDDYSRLNAHLRRLAKAINELTLEREESAALAAKDPAPRMIVHCQTDEEP